MTNFAMLFPGQGSQSLGMLHSFFKNNFLQHTFDEASNIIGVNLKKIIQEGPQDKLNDSQYTQPIILTASVSIYRLWRKMNGRLPLFMLGHSLGEYSALVCSKAIKFSDAIKIVSLRGKLMKKIVKNRPSSMKAIFGLNKKTINKICSKTTLKNIASISIFNPNNQIVVSGDKSAIRKVVINCQKAGAQSIFNLNINVPAHCKIMKPICKNLKNVLNKITINEPVVPIINNVDVKSEIKSKKIISALIRQMYNPVRWKENIDFILSKNVLSMLEIGPSKILTHLNKKNTNIISLCTNNLTNFLKAFKTIN